jgi:hypothetical protein
MNGLRQGWEGSGSGCALQLIEGRVCRAGMQGSAVIEQDVAGPLTRACSSKRGWAVVWECSACTSASSWQAPPPPMSQVACVSQSRENLGAA